MPHNFMRNASITDDLKRCNTVFNHRFMAPLTNRSNEGRIRTVANLPLRLVAKTPRLLDQQLRVRMVREELNVMVADDDGHIFSDLWIVSGWDGII